jgi:hypothetical protein
MFLLTISRFSRCRTQLIQHGFVPLLNNCLLWPATVLCTPRRIHQGQHPLLEGRPIQLEQQGSAWHRNVTTDWRARILRLLSKIPVLRRLDAFPRNPILFHRSAIPLLSHSSDSHSASVNRAICFICAGPLAVCIRAWFLADVCVSVEPTCGFNPQ